jgi:hypothetical protein
MSGYFYIIGGANYEKNESLIIDLDIIKETKKDNPSILYIPIAVNDDLNKINLFKNYYEKLGTKVEVLYSYNQELKIAEISTTSFMFSRRFAREIGGYKYLFKSSFNDIIHLVFGSVATPMIYSFRTKIVPHT